MNGSQSFLDLSLDPSKRHEKRVQNAPNDFQIDTLIAVSKNNQRRRTEVRVLVGAENEMRR